MCVGGGVAKCGGDTIWYVPSGWKSGGGDMPPPVPHQIAPMARLWSKWEGGGPAWRKEGVQV